MSRPCPYIYVWFLNDEHVIFYAGIEHVGGDMFHNIPKGDAIMLKVEFGYICLKYNKE